MKNGRYHHAHRNGGAAAALAARRAEKPDHDRRDRDRGSRGLCKVSASREARAAGAGYHTREPNLRDRAVGDPATQLEDHFERFNSAIIICHRIDADGVVHSSEYYHADPYIWLDPTPDLRDSPAEPEPPPINYWSSIAWGLVITAALFWMVS